MVGDNPERGRSEATLPKPCGACPHPGELREDQDQTCGTSVWKSIFERADSSTEVPHPPADISVPPECRHTPSSTRYRETLNLSV